MVNVKLTKDSYLPVDNILLISGYKTQSVVDDIRNKKKEGKVLNLTGGKKTLSVVYLKNGMVILLSLLPDTISERMEGKE